MADRVANGTLVADEVLVVSIQRHAGQITVTNRSEGGTIWARIDGADPEVGGEDCFPIMALDPRKFEVAVQAVDAAQIKLISDESLDYTVEGTSQ